MKNSLKDLLFQNLANTLTALGLLLAIWLLIIAITYPEHLWLMLLLAGLVGLTDFFDGKIARYLNIESNLGKAFDRLRDKIFVCPTLFILIWHYWPSSKESIILSTLTGALVLLIILIEILLFTACIIGVVKKLDVGSNPYGRAKMFCQFSVVFLWLISLNVEKYLEFPIFKSSIYLIVAILALTVYLAIKSLEGYFRRYTGENSEARTPQQKSSD